MTDIFFNEDVLLRRFEEIHDYIYANDGLSPQQVLTEFIKILFIKIYNENKNLNLFNITSEELKNIELKKDSTFFPRIADLFAKTKAEFTDIFDESEKISLTDTTLAYIVSKLQVITLTDSTNDAKGLAFQKFLSHKDKEANGQFFTPIPVIDFCVKFLAPKDGETIIDPCCGSGGFLYSAYKYIASNSTILSNDLISKKIFGFDINKDIVKISKMKFLLEQNGPNNILSHNSLDDVDTLKLIASGSNQDCREGFDVLLTNPPFGASGKISGTDILSRFDLGHKWKEKENSFVQTSALLNGQTSEILFVEQCLKLLKPEGRMAIVLPNSQFENPSLNYLRNYIISKARIIGIIGLPQETFIPYGTGIKTSLLFLQKKDNGNTEDYSVFFGRVTKLGYSGNKNATPCYKHDELGNLIKKDGKEIIDEDFSELLKAYEYYQSGKNVNTENAFSTKFSELKDRWDFNFYYPENKIFYERFEGKSKRLYELVDIVKVKSSKLKDKGADVEYVELSDVNTKSFEIINSSKMKVFELPSRASYELKDKDIITSVAGNSIGTKKHITALVNEEFEGAICTNGFRVLRNPKINMYYLLYFFSTDLFLRQVKTLRFGAAIPSVSDKDFADILVYLPEESEIESIGKKVEESFELRKKSISLLKEIVL